MGHVRLGDTTNGARGFGPGDRPCCAYEALPDFHDLVPAFPGDELTLGQRTCYTVAGEVDRLLEADTWMEPSR
jgi:hypothetical protein